MSGHTPPDMIKLRLIMPVFEHGKSQEFLFTPVDSASDIAQYVFDNWPEAWKSYHVEKPEILRLIFQGRFLHGNVTLGILQLPLGKTTVMHLVPRENLPKINSQEQNSRNKDQTNDCCSCLGNCSII